MRGLKRDGETGDRSDGGGGTDGEGDGDDGGGGGGGGGGGVHGAGSAPGGAGRRAARRMTPAATAATGGLAVAALTAFGLFAIGCSTNSTGIRDEGAAAAATAEPVPAPSAAGSAPPLATVDPVTLLRRDPRVSGQVKADLKPCAKDAYPVDASYGNLTGGTAPDVVITVMTCDDAVGLGAYVYRESGAREGYENVFVTEEPAVYATIDRGELVVTRQVYAKGDPVAYPSGEDVVTYAWADTRFAERYRVRNDYSGAVGNGPVADPLPSTPSDN